MSEERGPDERAEPSARRGRRRLGARELAAFGVAALAVGAVGWLRLEQRREVARARELWTAAAAVTGCFERVRGDATSLRERLRLRPPAELPLAECRPEVDRLRERHATLGASRWLSDRSGVASLGVLVGELARLPFDESARILARSDPAQPDRLAPLSAWSTSGPALACRVAVAAGAFDASCPGLGARRPSAPPLVHRVAFDHDAEDRLEDLVWAASSPREGQVAVTAAARVRDLEITRIWLATSRDGADRFELVTDALPAAAPGKLTAPQTAGGGDAPWRVLTRLPREDGGSQLLSSVGPNDGKTLGRARVLGPVPAGLAPVRVGTPLVEVATPSGSVPTLVLAPRPDGKRGGALLYLPADARPELRDLPKGALLAALAGPPPRVLLGAASDRSPSAVAQYPVPAPGAAWSASTPASLGAAGALSVTDAPERTCGVRDEKYAPLIARDGERATLLAVAPDRVHVLGFDAPKDDDLSLSCGACPPTLFSRSRERVALLLPVGHEIAPIPVATPVAFEEPGAARTANAACAREHYLVAYVASGQVLVQVARAGVWRFSPAQVLAGPDADGTPIDVQVVGLERRLVVLWRRVLGDLTRLRIELAASDDGGATWR